MLYSSVGKVLLHVSCAQMFSAVILGLIVGSIYFRLCSSCDSGMQNRSATYQPCPTHHFIIIVHFHSAMLRIACLLFDYCMFDLSVYYMYLQYFDTVGWVF